MPLLFSSKIFFDSNKGIATMSVYFTGIFVSGKCNYLCSFYTITKSAWINTVHLRIVSEFTNGIYGGWGEMCFVNMAIGKK